MMYTTRRGQLPHDSNSIFCRWVMKIVDSKLGVLVEVVHDSCADRGCYVPKCTHGPERGYKCATQDKWGCPLSALDDIDRLRGTIYPGRK
jgi:hypothetical protein